MKSLTRIFSIDICPYAAMSNHYAVILHIDDETPATWSQSEIIDRSTKLFSMPPLIQRYLQGKTTTDPEVNRVNDIVDEWRIRLTDISWYMRVLNESIARQANREHHCTGRFWAGRFKSQALLDDAAILACMAYADLNPIRAGRAQTLEESDLTSIQERLRQFARSHQGQASTPTDTNLITDKPADLLPLHGGEHIDAPEGIRFSLPDYLQLVDWTGKAVRDHKRGAIPARIPPILQRLDLNHEAWLEIVQHFGRRYRLATGAMDRLQQFGEQPVGTGSRGFTSRRLYHHQGETLIAQPEAAHDQAHSWQAL